MAHAPLRLSSRAATISCRRKRVAEAMYYYLFQSSRAATILYHLKQTAEAMYYNSFQSSRAATILYHRKQAAEAMWGRLATCGRLAIGLFVGQPILAAAAFQAASSSPRNVGFQPERRSGRDRLSLG
jgi:hypothetical protein